VLPISNTHSNTSSLNSKPKFNLRIMKHLYLVTVLFLLCFAAYGKQIDENTAMQVGQAFLVNNTNSPALRSTLSLKIAYRVISKSGSMVKSAAPSTYFYVFNADSRGFVIVAADDDVTPILGYSDEINFDPAHIPENVAKWLEGYKSEIRRVIENHIPATQEITAAWQKLKSGAGYSTQASATSVTPLLQTKWNQSPYYNDMCPVDAASGERTVTGCVATAMAQIMKFWNYPAAGSGFHSYNSEQFGTLSANFGSTTYDWASMPNELAGANQAVATLMYHVGVSVDMNYGPGSTGGSSAFVISAQSPVTNCSEYALKTYFGYKNTLQGIQRAYYTTTDWMNMLKTEFNASRPVLYAGFGGGGGHCFVADGYDNNDYVHFNWGWGGAYDGYFEINALNPDGLGIGGGTGSYNNGQQVIIGIEPPENTQSLDLKLYNLVTPSANPLPYAQAFTVTTNVANMGTATFNGDLAAAVFDDSYNFVDYVETKTNQSLQGGYAYTNDLVFSNSGLVTMLPGNYFIGIFYRPTGGNWAQLADNGSYINMIPVSVSYSNDIELNSAITVTPGNTLIQGAPVSVNLNILNNGSTTFTGQYAVAVYDLTGNPVQTIDMVNETGGLQPGYTYLSPFLTFSSNTLDVAPGSYLLAALHKPTNGSWQLTGSSTFQNPIRVIVQAAALQPDIYEPNNDVTETRELPVTFSNDAAHVTTPGSNCHVGNDYDYYKIDLPAGYQYTINPRLQDSYNSDDGNTYTLDAIFSMSPDGVQWSDAYDDIVNSPVVLTNGGTLYFMVSPYFTGETGTYLLDIKISRSTPSAVINQAASDLVRVYPNPARDHVWIDLSKFNGQVQQIELLDATGQQVIHRLWSPADKSVNLDLNTISEGIYFVRLYTDKGLLTKKIIIKY
jgi:hypothetical protein